MNVIARFFRMVWNFLWWGTLPRRKEQETPIPLPPMPMEKFGPKMDLTGFPVKETAPARNDSLWGPMVTGYAHNGRRRRNGKGHHPSVMARIRESRHQRNRRKRRERKERFGRQQLAIAV